MHTAPEKTSESSLKKSKDQVSLWAYRACLLAVLASLVPWVLFRFAAPTQYRGTFHLVTMIQGFFSLLLFLQVAYLPLAKAPSWERFLAPAAIFGFFIFYLCVWFKNLLPHNITMAIAMGIWLAIFWVVILSLKLRLKNDARAGMFFWLWVYLGLFFGHFGVGLTSLYVTLNELQVASPHWLLLVGRGFLFQADFLALGIAFFVLKFGLKNIGAQLAIAASLTVSFPLEEFVSPALGFGVRALGILMVVLIFAKPLKSSGPGRKSQPVEGRTLLTALGFILLGYCTVAIHPQYRLGGLHMVFLGGFLPVALLQLRPTNNLQRSLAFGFLHMAIVARFLCEVFSSYYPDLLLVSVILLAFSAGSWLWNPAQGKPNEG
ncbi:MAG: hypothetical protein QNL04_00450 [SAR324 cluster bacterium]|nr:hypothetical protein [SAR324 cluster bacterium]